MKRKINVGWYRYMVVGGLLAMQAPAYANSDGNMANSQTAPETAKTTALKRVKVQAQRRAVTQQPPSVATVVDGKALEQQRIYRFEDLPQVAPGMDIAAADPLDTRVTIRGIGDGGGSEINIGMPSSVGLFLDGVYLSRPGMMSNDLLDIDSVSVLKGPQGTLYGANTTGGAVVINTRKPTFTPQRSMEQSFGQRGYVQTKLMASGALSDSWAGRIDLSHTEKGGYIRNVENDHKLGGSRNNGVRGQLLYQPDDGFSLRIIGDYSDAHLSPVQSLIGTNAVDGVDQFRKKTNALGAKLATGREVALDDESSARMAQGGASVEANWKLSNGYNLRSLSSWRYFGYYPSTADGLSIPLYRNSGADVHDRIWSQEFRLDSPRGRTFDYTAGLAYWGENLDTFAHDHYYGGSQVTQYYGSSSNTGKYVQRWGELNDTQASAFAQGTWHVGDALDVTAGLRQTYEKKTGSFRRVNKNDFDSGKLEQTNHLPAATLNFTWFATSNVQPYLTLGYGEKSGGLNISSGAASKAGLDSLYIKPEKTRSAELGVKTHWLDRRVEFDTALFWSQVDDFQTTAYDVESQSSYLINAGKVRTRGIESRLAVRPVENLDISLSGTLLDARYLSFTNSKCPAEVSLASNAPSSCDLSGQRVFSSPRLSYNAHIRYEWGVWHDLRAFAAANWSYRSWAFGTVDDSAFTRIPSYGLLNLSTGVSGKYGNNDWRVSVWLNNALDKTYYRVTKAGDYGSAYAVLGEPRTLGVTFGYDF